MADDLTWVMLLARWTALAKATVALPDDAAGDRWRNAITPIITLQAVTHALGELDELAPDERALGLDKAELLIQTNAQALHELWASEPLPGSVVELLDDARAALADATEGGDEWTLTDEVAIFDHPSPVAAALHDTGIHDDVYLPTPGTPMFAPAPIAFARGPRGAPPSEQTIALIEAWCHSQQLTISTPTRRPRLRQVYRQFDFAAGGPVRDLVAASDATLPAGQPLLVPVLLGGEPQPITLLPRAIELPGPLPVVFSADAPGATTPDAAL